MPSPSAQVMSPIGVRVPQRKIAPITSLYPPNTVCDYTHRTCERNPRFGRSAYVSAWYRIAFLSVLASGCTALPSGAAAGIESAFDRAKASPPALRAFLQAMPKGGDLHSHLSGAVYAESYLRWGIEDGLCVHRERLVLLRCDTACTANGGSTCPEELGAAVADRTFRGRLIDALSTRNYRLYERSGHDQFFASFAAFGAAGTRPAEMLAEVMARAGRQNILYLELMVSPGMGEAAGLASGLVWNDDLAAMRAHFDDADLDRIAASVAAGLAETTAQARGLMGCGTEAPAPGCGVAVRFLAQAIRTRTAPEVFAQLVFGFHLARSTEQVVGINLVAPEDDPVALRDYSRHMRAVGFAARTAPGVGIGLHAGELTLGLVDPRHLRFHIREAVEVAGAQRIGHGTDVMYEDEPYDLLRLLKERDVLVEIILTSSEVILGVAGDEHPFPVYRAAGVPVALATDDEGVSRIDLTHEYQRAVETYDLTYADVKAMSYDSLAYGFLDADRKQELLAELERRFGVFEARHR